MQYKGITINPGAGGEWIFDSLPRTEFGHWARFIPLAEVESLRPGSGLSANEREQVLRTIIDRMVADAPVELGNIRQEPLLSIQRIIKQVFRKIA